MELKTVEMVRKIRDEHYNLLKEKTIEEQFIIYREATRRVYERAQQELVKQTLKYREH
jgi:hypothetical protein